VHGLLKKSEYNNDMGVVTKEAEGGRWCVVLDKGKEISLKVDNLEVHVDTADIDNLESGSIVCKAHRLEVCGGCGIDYSTVNSERAARAVGAAEQPLTMRAKKLGAQDDGLQNLDPSILTRIVDTRARSEWGDRGPLQQAFTLSFSLHEKFMSHVNQRPTIDEDLTFHVREDLLSVAWTYEADKCRCKIIQDDDKSLAIFLLILGAFALPSSGNDDGPPDPVILVWYQTNSVTDPKFMEKMQCMGPAMQEVKLVGTPLVGEKEGMADLTTHRKEVEAINILLEHNSKLLSPTWLATNKPPTSFTVSFLTPLKKKIMSHEAGAGSGIACVCGAPQVSYCLFNRMC
jgi:hypothetical protein